MDNVASTRQAWIFFFGQGQADGGQEVQHLVGGKGASLAEMTKARLPVPPGFTISADCCRRYFEAGNHWPDGLRDSVRDAMTRLEQWTGRAFGQGDQPLLVAVRSGAAVSMPGMMDTLLNVGLHPDGVRRLARSSGQAQAAWLRYWRFLRSFAGTARQLPDAVADRVLQEIRSQTGKSAEEDLDADELERLCERFRDAYRDASGADLPTDPEELLFEAIEAVFHSWNSERAVRYRQRQGIDGLLGTAVNIQAMCPADIAGVLFTTNPVQPESGELIIEAVPGLGEALVQGQVTPDQFVLSRADLRVARRVPAPGQSDDNPLLSDDQLRELAELGLRVERYFGHPCDIEWAWAAGQFHLLQARAIRGVSEPRNDSAAAETERVRREEIARLAAGAAPEGTVWSRFNLAEVLPEPTPMTWAIVRRFMSGQGGYGLMYRDLGFDPDPALDEEGIFDLVCGRPYCNLSREPKMQYRLLPFEHDFAALKRQPRQALYPQAVLNPARVGWRLWWRLPRILWQLVRSIRRIGQLSKTFAERFRHDIIPPFVEATVAEARTDYSPLTAAELLQRLEHWIRRTLHDFARESLKPTVLASITMANLERTLIRLLQRQAAGRATGSAPPEEYVHQARSWIQRQLMGVRPDPDADLAAALRDMTEGKLDHATFLARFGHRGSAEMELAQPRWGEDADSLNRYAAPPVPGPSSETRPADQPAAAVDESIFSKLTPAQERALARQVATLKTFLSLRETGKHHLMRGYALIRRLLVTLDRRYNLAGGIFYLTPEELPALISGTDFADVIQQRRRQRAMLLSLPVPLVLFSDDLEAIGRAAETASGTVFQGIPLSAGVVEGMALVAEQPTVCLPDGNEAFVLVCPTTDPAWVPLFLQAQGLVMEAGGMLSHGAIIAREFGLPAVAGIPGIHHILRTGQRVRVNGQTGEVRLVD
ncbi:MAG: PEP/pyruvate-binding domain-containing protein [Gemmataceae bacterium]